MSTLARTRPPRSPAPVPAAERKRLERRVRQLAWAGNAWHLIEFGVAVAAGIAAGSVALVAFGFDSVIELASGTVVIWLFSGGRGSSHAAERRAQMLIAASYALLVVYVVLEVLRDLAQGNQAAVSWVGIMLAAVAAVTMPVLARTKRNVGRKLTSSATVSEAGQNMICAYLAIALLLGLLANALFGWWWADPAAALVIAAVAAREGLEAARGERCGDDC